MHELGIVSGILETVTAAAREAGAWRGGAVLLRGREEFDLDRFHVRCPACGGRDTHLLRGRELDLVSMEVES